MKQPTLIPSTIPVPDPTQLTTDAVDRAKREVDTRIQALRELIDQKFVGVAKEFTMRDMALTAAFKAAEAAVAQQNQSNTLAADKAQSAITKQMDNLDEKINNLKEGMSELANKNWSALGAYLVGILGAIGVVITIIGVFITFKS